MKFKKLLLVMFAAFLFTSCMTMKYTNVEFGPDEFVKIYEVDGLKDALFLKSNEWMIGIFNNASSVIQHSDKQEGVIIGKYLMYGNVSAGLYGTTNDSRIYAIIDIRVKDGKARLAIQPEVWHYAQGMMGNAFTKEVALAKMNSLAEDFSKGLNKKQVDF